MKTPIIVLNAALFIFSILIVGCTTSSQEDDTKQSQKQQV